MIRYLHAGVLYDNKLIRQNNIFLEQRYMVNSKSPTQVS